MNYVYTIFRVFMQEILDFLNSKDVTFSFPTGGVFLPVG